jgi:chlorite dismutase
MPNPSTQFVQALGLGLDPAWRRRTNAERSADWEDFSTTLTADESLVTPPSSPRGLRAGIDVLLWRLAPSLEALERSAAALLQSGTGRWLTVAQSFLGLIVPSQYVKRPTVQEQSLFTGERSKYLVVYPFTKDTSWYLMGRESRQGVMNEHMRIGHNYPQVRQLLANSFGLDDMDFLVAYETDDLPAFSQLVRDLRGTDSRRSTVRDAPILTAVHHTPQEIGELLGA